MSKEDGGLDAEEILDELEVPTAAYEVWAKEENEEDKMEIFRNLPKVATVHNELYRDNDVEEALKEAVQQARQRELRRILDKIGKHVEKHREVIEENPPDIEIEAKQERKIAALQILKDEFEEEVEE